MAANFNHTKYLALQQGNKVKRALYSKETKRYKTLINRNLKINYTPLTFYYSCVKKL
jgi:hypothetical protein